MTQGEEDDSLINKLSHFMLQCVYFVKSKPGSHGNRFGVCFIKAIFASGRTVPPSSSEMSVTHGLSAYCLNEYL